MIRIRRLIEYVFEDIDSAVEHLEKMALPPNGGRDSWQGKPWSRTRIMESSTDEEAINDVRLREAMRRAE